MRFSILLLILVTIVLVSSASNSKRRKKKTDGRVETIVLVCLLGPFFSDPLSGVGTGEVTTWALNARGQAQVNNRKIGKSAKSPTYVYIHHSDLPEFQDRFPDGLWIAGLGIREPARGQIDDRSRVLSATAPGPRRDSGPYFLSRLGSARRLLASGADSETGSVCEEHHLRLPVEPVVIPTQRTSRDLSSVTSYRVPDSMANIEPEDCRFWSGELAKKFNLGPLAPPTCLENQLKPAQTVAQTAAQTATSKLHPSLRMITPDNKYKPGVGAVTFSKDDPGRVQAAQKVQNFPTWQLWGVVVIAVVLLLVTCFASSQQKEVDVYSPLKQNVDEF